ncbi:hypothetical protein [Kaarinaea lacus]
MVIQNCRDVRIINAKVGELVVTESRVVIENSTIGGKVPVALASVGSDIKITSSTIWGASAIKTARSRFDLAAVDIDYQDNIITGESGSQFIFSVSRLKKDFNSRSIHGVVKTGAGNYPTIEISSKLDEVIEGVNKAFGWE